jgi:DNA-directed RNA polymerase II subunit RPB2
LDKGEIFGMPDELKTMDIKKGIIKDHLKDHVIKEGTVVKENYVLIEKVLKLAKQTKQYIYSDKSVVYKKKYENVVVEKVITARDDEDIQTTKVKLRASRPLRVGDKLSSRTGNKGVVCSMITRAACPYTEDGLVPDLIVNPHTIPTRRAINQMIECFLAQIATELGVFIDMTAFKQMDIESQYKYAIDLGKKYGGYKRMYCGRTGMWIDSLIFIGPTSYQRLQKFVVDECQIVRTGPTTPLTHQPLAGKAHDGSLRIGEMETWCLLAQGCGRVLHEKFHQDSDGTYTYICRNCCNIAVVNNELKMYRCKTCRGDADIVAVPSCWASQLFFSELRAMNVKTTYELEPIMFKH